MNSVQLLGNLARDPEVRYTQSGKVVVTFTVAASNTYIDSATNDVYTNVVDELNPLKELMDQIEKETGEKIAFEDNVFFQAWLARGWAGKAEALLEHGAPERGIKGLEEIVNTISKKEHKDFSAYLVALHDLDLHRNKQKATFDYCGGR